jgi:hypothetical protein
MTYTRRTRGRHRHGHLEDGRHPPEYAIRATILWRCYNPHCQQYGSYGGKGVGVCDRRRAAGGFSNFLADLGPQPRPGDGLRRLDERWQRVVDLAERDETATSRWDDDWVRRGLVYLTRLRCRRDDSERRGLAELMPDLDAAYAVHKHADKLTRGALEARLLARQTVEETAAAGDLTPEAVKAYAALFFQILGRLDADMFITINAVGPKMWDGSLTEDDPDLLLKLFAYLKGPIFLDVVPRDFRGWPGRSLPERLEEAGLDELDDAADMLGTRALILAKVLPFPDCCRALRLSSLAEELRRYVDGRRAAESRPSGDGPFGLTPPLTAPADMEATADCDGEGQTEQADPDAWWTARRAAVLAA